MTARRSAAAFLPAAQNLDALRNAARGCRGCELYCRATQTVFGEGPAHTGLMLVGETPGDREDLAGRPFVGPAGRLLFAVLEDLGIHREEVYVTNVVKHFKWSPRGKHRIHQTPGASELHACLPWLHAELDAVRPELIVCLGAPALAALAGPEADSVRDRGRLLETNYGACLATVDPSSILRADRQQRAAGLAAFRRDLETGIEYLERGGWLDQESAG